MSNGSLSPKQLAALRWVETYGTIPPVDPRTWKSLVARGLVVLNRDGTMAKV